jgi:hypothetical protein
MSRHTVTLVVLAVVTASSARELSAQQAVPSGGPSAPKTATAPEPPVAPPLGLGPSRLFFAPTARSLPRGTGSLGVTEIVFPSGEVGLTNRLSLRAFGVPPLEGLSDGGIVLAPKVQLLASSRVQGAVGAAQTFGSGWTGGIVYGVVTLGSADTAVTVGCGYGYGQVADSEGSPAAFFFGAEKAVGRSWRLVAEGYVGGAALGLPDQTLVGGTRFSRGRWSADLGGVVPVYQSGVGMPFPFFTIAWAF